MNSHIASLGFAAGIIVLFVLDRDKKVSTSAALWLPILWLAIAASRNLSEWFGGGPQTAAGTSYLEGSAIDRNVLTGILFLGVIALIGRRQRVGDLLRLNLPIVLFVLYCGVSVIWSDFPAVSFKRWIRSLGDIVMILIVLTERDWAAAGNRLLARVGFLVIPLSLLLIRYYPDTGRAYGMFDGKLSWTGVTTSKNLLGMICLIFGLAAVSRFVELYQAEKGGHRTSGLIAQGALLAVSLWVLRQSDSATALGCFLMAGGVMVMTSFPVLARKSWLVHLVTLAVLIVATSSVLLGVGSGLIQGLGRDATLTGRDEIWRLVVKTSGSPLLGAGFESFWLGSRLLRVAAAFGHPLNQAHNGYIEVYINLGLAGAVLLALVLATGYHTVIAAVVRQDNLGGLRLAYFIVAVTYNFTEAAFKMMHPVWIVALLAIMVIPQSRLVKSLPETNRQVLGTRSEWHHVADECRAGSLSRAMLLSPTAIPHPSRYSLRCQ